jgi:hypothetical protein
MKETMRNAAIALLSMTTFLTVPGIAATSPLTLSSSNTSLVDGFNWAKTTALGYVQTGKTGSIPCYWAGLLDRKAFYSRDAYHQLTGAHLLGLDTENFTMIRKFAASATEARKYYPLWAFGFDGTIYTLDYANDNTFVREIPAAFEGVEKGHEQYQWTGNRQWVDDQMLWTFYSKATDPFITLHDGNKNGVAEEHSTNIFAGVATYNENGEGLIEAGDGIGSEYQALVAASRIQAIKGDSAGSAATAKRAADLKSYFAQNWWSASANRYVRGFVSPWTPKTDFGKENSWFMPLKLITEPGARTDGYLDFIDNSVKALPKFNIEAYTYLPDVFYPYGRNEQGWYWLNYCLSSRSGYPEVSFTAISQITTGMMGIEPDAPNHGLATLPRLPSSVSWAALDHVPLGGHDIRVRHDGGVKTTLTHNAGPAPLAWEVRFYGSYPTISIDGAGRSAGKKSINGKEISFVTITVESGKTVTAEAATTGAMMVDKAGENRGRLVRYDSHARRFVLQGFGTAGAGRAATVVDVAGNMVDRVPLEYNACAAMPPAPYPSGMYIVLIQDGRRTFAHRIAVTR